MRSPIIQLAAPGQVDRRPHGQHPGLILQRYLTRPVAEKDGGSDEKRKVALPGFEWVEP
jgi:hypothetical protein